VVVNEIALSALLYYSAQNSGKGVILRSTENPGRTRKILQH
jgi:hypothetical protein